MSLLTRPVLVVSNQQRIKVLPAISACQSCPSPCHAAEDVPAEAVLSEITLPSDVLNRLALAFFGLPLAVLGVVIWLVQDLSGHSTLPLVLLLALATACALGGVLAKKSLPEVERALKASGVRPTISGV